MTISTVNSRERSHIREKSSVPLLPLDHPLEYKRSRRSLESSLSLPVVCSKKKQKKKKQKKEEESSDTHRERGGGGSSGRALSREFIHGDRLSRGFTYLNVTIGRQVSTERLR